MGKASVTLELNGAEALKRQFSALPDRMRTRVLKGAVRDAAEVIKAEAASRVPVGETGNLAGSLVVKAGKPSRTFAGAAVGHTRKGAHAHLVEFGTQPHAIVMSKGGIVQHPGSRPRPYLFPAFELKKGEARKVIESALQEAIQEAAGG